MYLTTHIILILGNIIISVFASIIALSTFTGANVAVSYLIGGGVFRRALRNYLDNYAVVCMIVRHEGAEKGLRCGTG